MKRKRFWLIVGSAALILPFVFSLLGGYAEAQGPKPG